MLQLRKLYVDFVTADGSVCIAYVTRVRAAGLGLAPAGLERYDAPGRREVVRGRAELALDHEPEALELSPLRLVLGGQAYLLELAPEQAELAPSPAAPDDFVWRVKAARAHVRLTRLDGGAPPIEGTGYADWVELERSPRAMRLARLHWGRLHLAAGTVIYTCLERTDGSRWRAATSWPHGQPARAIERWSLRTGAEPEQHVLQLEDLGASFELQALRTLHAGEAVDAERFPARAERWLSSLLAGRVSERRFLSRVRSTTFGDGVAVHESVCFGDTPWSTP